MDEESTKKPRRVSDQEIEETIIEFCRQAGLEGKVRPEDVARTILPDHWRTLLHRMRVTSVHLTHAGHVEILRKGKAADPDDFKGIYHLRITAKGIEDGEAS